VAARLQAPSRAGFFQIFGVAGGWRDWWDDPADHAELRAQAVATERRLAATAERIGRRWQRQIAAEQARKRRGGSG
jgi:hypothetical protein